MMVRFREHRGGLEDSLSTTVQVLDRAELVALIARKWEPLGITVCDADVEVKPYVRGSWKADDRGGWADLHIVTLVGHGPIGFTEGPVPDQIL